VKKVALFGGSGFIGKEVAKAIAANAELELVLAPSGLLRQTDLTQLTEFLSQQAPDWILQFTGVSLPATLGLPAFEEANVLTTKRLALALEAVGKISTPVFVLGSAAEIGSSAPVPADETAVCAPSSDYGVSKFNQTKFVEQQNKLGFCFSVLRLFNIIGPGMSRDRVPACFISGLQTGTLVTEALSFKRDYLDVRDLAHIVCELILKKWHGNLLHICSGSGVTGTQIIDLLIQITHSKATVSQKGDAPHFRNFDSVGNPQKLKSLVSFTRTTLEQTLMDIVQAN
jgi:nucleoside-diphosphate-sugar epimerase